MKHWSRTLGTLTLGSALALVAAACGKLSSGGEGSETHWLLKCETDRDCGAAQCLCGVCTLPCTSLRDCPVPLDQCLPRVPTGDSCELPVCGSSEADSSTQALATAAPYPTDRVETCEAGRQVALIRIDVGYDTTEPGRRAANAVVADYPSGFLFFGGETGHFYRVSPHGQLVRELPPPVTASRDVHFQSAAPLEDGTLWLGGMAGDRAWVGKVDTAWGVVSERELDVDAALEVMVRALPDGGALVLAHAGATSTSITDVYWARLSSAGEVVWQNELRIEATEAEPRIVLADSGIEVAVTQPDGVHFLSGDLEGAYELTSLPVDSESVAVALLSLPGNQLALLTDKTLSILDEARRLVGGRVLGDARLVGADIAFDARRNEVLFAGSHTDYSACNTCPRTGGYLESMLVGERPWGTWHHRRAYWPDSPIDFREANRYGNDFTRVVIDASGNAVALGAIETSWLSMTWVGSEACGG